MLDPFRPLALYAAAGALALSVAFGVVQTVRLAGAKQAHAETIAAHADTLRNIAQLSVTAADKMVKANEALQVAANAVDRQHFKELSDEQEKNRQLAAGLAAGTNRMWINARCPAPPRRSDDVPAAAAAPRVDAPAAVEVVGETRQAVLAIRSDVSEDRAKLAGLQEYVKRVCPGAQ